MILLKIESKTHPSYFYVLKLGLCSFYKAISGHLKYSIRCMPFDCVVGYQNNAYDHDENYSVWTNFNI